MAILMGTGLVYKEIDKKTIFPAGQTDSPLGIHCWGKYLGLVLTIFIMTVLMSVIFLVVLFLHTLPLSGTLYFWPFSISFFELCLMTAVLMVFSTFTTPILASLYSLAFYLIGHLSWSLELLIKKVKSGGGRAILKKCSMSSCQTLRTLILKPKWSTSCQFLLN